MTMYPNQSSSIKAYVITGVVFFVLLIPTFMYLHPQYVVWEQGQVGQAEYARAEQNRKIRILEAQAEKESAALKAEAEVIRARGLAQANEIIGNSLAGEAGKRYLHYQWIQGLEKGDNREVIYVATEGGMPITEAGRLPQVEAAAVKK